VTRKLLETLGDWAGIAFMLVLLAIMCIFGGRSIDALEEDAW